MSFSFKKGLGEVVLALLIGIVGSASLTACGGDSRECSVDIDCPGIQVCLNDKCFSPGRDGSDGGDDGGAGGDDGGAGGDDGGAGGDDGGAGGDDGGVGGDDGGAGGDDGGAGGDDGGAGGDDGGAGGDDGGCEEIVLEGNEVADMGWAYYFHFNLDSSGHAHLCLEPTSDDKLYYRTNKDGSWSDREYIGVTSDVGSTRVSVAIDTSDKVHVAYDGGIGDVLWYATNKGGSWSTGSVVNGKKYSLDLTTADEPRVAYEGAHAQGDGIILASLSLVQGSWSHALVEECECRDPDLVIDSSNVLHIVYGDRGTYKIRYATNASGSWAFEDVATSEPLLRARLAVAPNGALNVVFKYDGILYLIRKIPPAVNWGTPEPISASARGFDVAVDDTGYVYVAYIDNDLDPKALMLAAERSDGSFAELSLMRSTSMGGDGPMVQAHGDRVHVFNTMYSESEMRHAWLRRVTCP